MNKHQLLGTSIAVMVGAMTLTGCSLHIGEFSTNTLRTGPTQSEKIDVAKPEDASTTWGVEISPAAANVTVDSKGESLINGLVTYNVHEYKPLVSTSTNKAVVRTPAVWGSTNGDVRVDWNLSLGKGIPMNMTVNTGASKGTWELGGLSLHNLSWRQGAADTRLMFSEPNPVELSYMRYDMGAAKSVINGLGNANLRSGLITLGAGDLSLYLDGKLLHDVDLTIEGGVSHIAIYSGGNPVRVTFDGAISAINANGWSHSGRAYTSPEWAAGTSPMFNVTVKLGMGSVALNTGQ